jgi:hypothetical protein
MARPTKYSKELIEAICNKISTSHKSLKKICKEEGIEMKTVFNWLNDEKHSEFLQLYTRAREAQADYLADEMLEIALRRTGDDTAFVGINRIHRDKLVIDTMKFIASKLKPKKYGDKMDVTSDGEKITSVQVTVVRSDAPLSSSEKDVKLD